jgi:hypothetical protein
MEQGAQEGNGIVSAIYMLLLPGSSAPGFEACLVTTLQFMISVHSMFTS